MLTFGLLTFEESLKSDVLLFNFLDVVAESNLHSNHFELKVLKFADDLDLGFVRGFLIYPTF